MKPPIAPRRRDIAQQPQQEQQCIHTKNNNYKISSYGNNVSSNSIAFTAGNRTISKRRDVLFLSLLAGTPRRVQQARFIVPLTPSVPFFVVPAKVAHAKCTDLETCREIGEKKIQQDLKDNPIFKLDSGVRYKILRPGIGNDNDTVHQDSIVDVAFSVSRLGAGYMFSRGFGYEKIDAGNGKMISDAGMDSIRIHMGERNVPLGIEYALLGMKKGERRRVELPAEMGFETSNWQPEPLTGRGKLSMMAYKRILEGYGPGTVQPGFPAETIWDIEVLRIRK